MADYGFVYCLGNDCMPGVYKVGMTDRAPSKRCEELSSSTSVPDDFDLLFFIEVFDALKIERAIHRLLDEYRIKQSREFFRCDLRVIHRHFEIYKLDGCPYCITNSGSGAIASLDWDESLKDKDPVKKDFYSSEA